MCSRDNDIVAPEKLDDVVELCSSYGTIEDAYIAQGLTAAGTSTKEK